MDQKILDLIDEILESEELECVPYHHVENVGFYVKDHGWCHSSLEEFVDFYEEGFYDELDISDINYYLDYDSFIGSIHDNIKRFFEGIK